MHRRAQCQTGRHPTMPTDPGNAVAATPGQRHRSPPNPADLVMLAPVITASCAAYLGVGLEVIIQETRDVASGTQSPTS